MSIEGIIENAGGAQLISDESQGTKRPIQHWAVYKWPKIGIPDDHWPLIIRLARVTPQQIYDANQALKQVTAA